MWNLAPEKTFNADDAQAAVQYGLEHLDAGFFTSRWERATPAERRFLLAMAADHDAPSSTSDVARRLGLKITSLGPYRANLMSKGLVYAPDLGRNGRFADGDRLDRFRPAAERASARCPALKR